MAGLAVLVSCSFFATPSCAHMTGRDYYSMDGLQQKGGSIQADLAESGMERLSVHAGGYLIGHDRHSPRLGDENQSQLSKKVEAGIKSLSKEAVSEHKQEDPDKGDTEIKKAETAPSKNGKVEDAEIKKAETAPSENGKAPDSVCEKSIFARDDACPDSCPLAAEMEKDYCHFRCVKEKECGTQGTVKEATITDRDLHMCRRCDVEGCLHCVAGKPGEDIEKCETCMPGYFLTEEGECEGVGEWVFTVIAVVAFLALLLVLLWYFDLVNRFVVNGEGIKYALECRHRSKLRQPQDTEPGVDGIGPRMIYPFNTNLCSQNVAGPGNMLFFRFQAAGLIWIVVVLLAWVIIGLATSTDIFVLGLRQATTPQLMCAVVKWGRHRQVELMYTKVYWLAFTYLFSFIGAICLAVNSHSLAQTLDNQFDSMSDYVAICHDLPVLTGDVDCETLIKEAVENKTGEKVVGVSVCWNFHNQAAKVVTALEEEVGSIEASRATNNRRSRSSRSSRTMDMFAAAEAEPHEDPGCLTGIMDSVNGLVLGKWKVHLEEKHGHEDEKTEDYGKMLKEMESSSCAFVVFETEDGRDRALAAVEEQPVPIEGGHFTLNPESHEPESCCWEDFHVTEAVIGMRLLSGSLKMLVALIGWTVLLYLPYAHYMGSFSYANGDKPGEISEVIFISLVVAAQIGLFVLSGHISHHSGFCYEDDKQRVYILMYNSALILNLILDISLTAVLSYHQMVGRGVHCADGRLLADLTTYLEIFQSYPMQKAIGRQLLKYCWPATFLLPFAAEPVFVNYFPYHIGRLFIQSNKQLIGERAEKALELPEQEQGRYADIIFNMILFCCVPFVAGGYILVIGGAMMFSHIYIYFYDHWKVLRAVTSFYFASDVVFKFGQKLFSIPLAIILTAFGFKANQMCSKTGQLGTGYFEGYELGRVLVAMFFGHIVVHCCILDYFVPAVSRVEVKNTKAPYAETAANMPCTWFSANPVHCLRSKYIKKDNPPQVFYVAGKEHLMKKNPAIGAYFEQGESDLGVEDSEDLGF